MAAGDNWILCTLGKTFLRLAGWRWEGAPPRDPKFVCVVAPHTSNWDFVYCIMGSFALRVYGSWVGKRSLFVGPLSPLFRWLGGIPVDRSAVNGIVGQMVHEFRTRERMVFVITPEGTRTRTPYWRAGFYEIAHQAGVPVALCYADYARKACGFGPTVRLTGDRAADMARIAAFYAGIAPRHPELAGPVQLRPADEPKA